MLCTTSHVLSVCLVVAVAFTIFIMIELVIHELYSHIHIYVCCIWNRLVWAIGPILLWIYHRNVIKPIYNGMCVDLLYVAVIFITYNIESDHCTNYIHSIHLIVTPVHWVLRWNCISYIVIKCSRACRGPQIFRLEFIYLFQNQNNFHFFGFECMRGGGEFFSLGFSCWRSDRILFWQMRCFIIFFTTWTHTHTHFLSFWVVWN